MTKCYSGAHSYYSLYNMVCFSSHILHVAVDYNNKCICMCMKMAFSNHQAAKSRQTKKEKNKENSLKDECLCTNSASDYKFQRSPSVPCCSKGFSVPKMKPFQFIGDNRGLRIMKQSTSPVQTKQTCT